MHLHLYEHCMIKKWIDGIAYKCELFFVRRNASEESSQPFFVNLERVQISHTNSNIVVQGCS